MAEQAAVVTPPQASNTADVTRRHVRGYMELRRDLPLTATEDIKKYW
ncbi:MAG: hypothetical protein GY696_02050 [Gammaproteobacteria bacterium]|nr:hypothetical protein [Gammaproteobacteria bacterium]